MSKVVSMNRVVKMVVVLEKFFVFYGLVSIVVRVVLSVICLYRLRFIFEGNVRVKSYGCVLG